LAWLPVPFFLIAIGLLAFLPVEAAWLPPLLLPALNIFFLTFVSFLVSVLAARSYLAGHSMAVLFLGCGTLALGLGGAVAVFTPAKTTPNWMVTIYNSGAFFAGVCHLVSAIRAFSASKRPPRSGWTVLVFFYLVVIAIIVMLAIAVYHDLLPTFFIEGQGATFWDVLVLWTAAGLFALSALLLSVRLDEEKDDFRRWYSLGLGLIAVGLVGVSAQTRLGDPLNWAGRTSQYLGGVYMLIAVISSIRRSGTWMLPLKQALRESEGRYQSLVNLCPDAILVHTNGKYSFANPAAVKLLAARSPEEVVGKGVMDLVHPDHRQSFSQRIAQTYDGVIAPLRETRFLRMDGHPIDVEVTCAAVDFGGKPAIQIVVRDITERKRAEAALEAARTAAVNESNRLQAVMETLPVGVAILDANGGTVHSNSMFDGVWGDPRPAMREVSDYAVVPVVDDDK
jgi:PAS domain S-box-containing protein